MKQKSAPLVLFDKVLWDVISVDERFPGLNSIRGPYCQSCKRKLNLRDEENEFQNELICNKCKKHYDLKYSYSETLESVADEYLAKQRTFRDIISLDLPPTKIETYDSDENYFISAKLTQREGRRLMVVYVGEKKNKQDSKDYAQFFVDLDQDQIRYDTTNKMPEEFLAIFVAEFRKNTTKTVLKK